MPQALLMTDPYRALGECMPEQQRLAHLYRVLREHYEGIQRFAIALYDPNTRMVSSYMSESDDLMPLAEYSQPLQHVPSLAELAELSVVRVVDDMRIFRGDDVCSEHSQALLAEGLRSSFTIPLRHNGQLLGFLFLNSRQVGYFTADVAAYCSLWAHLVEQLFVLHNQAPEVAD